MYDVPNYTGGYMLVAALAVPVVALLVSACVGRRVEVAWRLFWRRRGGFVRRVAVIDVGWLFAPAVRVVSAVRFVVSPRREIRRRVGRRLAAPHPGLTDYEQMALDIESLPRGAARLALRLQLRSMPPPSAACIAKARDMRGRCVAPEGLVHCLIRGEKPSYYNDVV